MKIRSRLSTKVKNDRYRRLSAEDAGGGQRRQVAIQTRHGIPYYLPTTGPPSVDVVVSGEGEGGRGRLWLRWASDERFAEIFGFAMVS